MRYTNKEQQNTTIDTVVVAVNMPTTSADAETSARDESAVNKTVDVPSDFVDAEPSTDKRNEKTERVTPQALLHLACRTHRHQLSQKSSTYVRWN